MAFALLLDRCPACGRSRGRGFAVGMARYGDACQAYVRARAVGVDAGADRPPPLCATAAASPRPYSCSSPIRPGTPTIRSLALLYYGLAGIARAWGDDDLRLYYLAESSVADLRAGTRSYASLYDLALLLFDRKDYDRAAAYMGSASDDAMHCRSMVRIPVSSSAAVKISEAISSNIAQRRP